MAYCEVNNLRLVPVRSKNKSLSLNNIYGVKWDKKRSLDNENLFILIDKFKNTILGYINFLNVLSEQQTLASLIVDTTPLENINRGCLEIYDFEIADIIWDSPSFKWNLCLLINELLNQYGSSSLLIHYTDHFEHDQQDLFKALDGTAFYSRQIHLERYQKNSSKYLNDSICPDGDHDKFDSFKTLKSIKMPNRLRQLLHCGLEIWSEPIIYSNKNMFTLVLGYLWNSDFQFLKQSSSVKNKLTLNSMAHSLS
jgi:hypothetical protein